MWGGSGFSHLLGLLLVNLVDFNSVAFDGIADLLILLKVPIGHLPVLEAADHGVLGADLLHSLGELTLELLHHGLQEFGILSTCRAFLLSSSDRDIEVIKETHCVAGH